MRLVNFREFLTLPPGTLFSKYEPFVFGPLCIKEASIPNDFFYQCLVDSIQFTRELTDAFLQLEEGMDIPVDMDSLERDGCFDEDQLFVVWSHTDVDQLIKRLQSTQKEIQHENNLN